MYVLLHPATMGEVLAAFPELVVSFARREPGAEQVLSDALLEYAVWSVPLQQRGAWKLAQKERDRRPKLNLFWIGNGQIRQNVIRTGGHRGWKEIDATASVHRADRIRAQEIRARELHRQRREGEF